MTKIDIGKENGTKTFTKGEIFEAFEDQWVVCELIEETNDVYKYLVRFASKNFEEVNAWKKEHAKNYGLLQIFHGRLPREGTQVVESNGVTLEDIVGTWRGFSVGEINRDIISSFDITLLPTGKAVLQNQGCTLILDWYIENDTFTLERDSCSISYRGSFSYFGYRDGDHRPPSFKLEGYSTNYGLYWMPFMLYKQNSRGNYLEDLQRSESLYDHYLKAEPLCCQYDICGCERL